MSVVVVCCLLFVVFGLVVFVFVGWPLVEVCVVCCMLCVVCVTFVFVIVYY